MTRRRYNKRQRNKSSPQTAQDSKKYRSTLVEDITEVETESDNSDISGLSSNTTEKSETVIMATADETETSMDTNVQMNPSADSRDLPSQAQPLSSQDEQMHCPPPQIDTPPPPPPPPPALSKSAFDGVKYGSSNGSKHVYAFCVANKYEYEYTATNVGTCRSDTACTPYISDLRL